VLVRRLFTKAAQHNVTINVGKLVFAQPSAKFGGYIMNSTGFQPKSGFDEGNQRVSSTKQRHEHTVFTWFVPAGWSFFYKGGQNLQTFVPPLEKRLHLGVDDGIRQGFSKRNPSSGSR
jgi:hypothetical protein